MNRSSALRALESTLLVFAFVIAGIAIVGGCLYGLPRVSLLVYRFSNPAAGFVFLLDLLFLPLAVLRRLRRAIGAMIFVSSFLFGLNLWLLSAMVAFSFWGYFGLFIGLIWVGIGVVPVALLAAAFGGAWALVGAITANFAFVRGARILGAWLSGEKL